MRFIHIVACIRWFPHTDADLYFAEQSWAPCVPLFALELSLVNSSSLGLLHLVSLLGSAYVTHPCPAAWKHSQGNRLWQSLSSPGLFPISSLLVLFFLSIKVVKMLHLLWRSTAILNLRDQSNLKWWMLWIHWLNSSYTFSLLNPSTQIRKQLSSLGQFSPLLVSYDVPSCWKGALYHSIFVSSDFVWYKFSCEFLSLPFNLSHNLVYLHLHWIFPKRQQHIQWLPLEFLFPSTSLAVFSVSSYPLLSKLLKISLIPTSNPCIRSFSFSPIFIIKGFNFINFNLFIFLCLTTFSRSGFQGIYNQ